MSSISIPKDDNFRVTYTPHKGLVVRCTNRQARRYNNGQRERVCRSQLEVRDFIIGFTVSNSDSADHSETTQSSEKLIPSGSARNTRPPLIKRHGNHYHVMQISPR